MANNKYITVDQLNNVISKIDKNFSKKKNSLTKIELKELKVANFPNGEITKDGLYLVETYVDHGVLEADGVTTRVHVDYIEVNVELGTSIEDWASGKDYKVNDLVIVDSTKLYKCKTAPQVDNTTFDKDEWTKISSSEIYTDTIDSTSFALNSTSGLYEYEFNNPFGTSIVICSLQKVSDNSLMLDTIKVTDTKIKVLLNTPESVVINIVGGDGVDETTILKDSLTAEQLRLLGVVQSQEGEITSLELIEHKDDITDPDLVTSKELQFDGKRLLTTDDITNSIEDWVSGTDYSVGTLVIYNDKLYQCKIVPVDNTVFDTNEWTLIGIGGEVFTLTIDQTSFALVDGVYEYEFNNPFKSKNIVCSLQKSDGSVMLDSIIVTDDKIKVILNVPETVIFNAIGYTVDENLIIKDALTDEQKRLLNVVKTQENEITSLKVEELYEDSTNPTEITGYKLLFKEKDSLGNIDVTSELIQEKDFAKKFIDDTISKTDPKATEKLLSAKYVLDAIDLLSGVDMSSFAKKDDIYYYHTTYTRCLQTDDGAKEVVSVVTDNAIQVLYDDVVLQIADIVLNEWVKEGIAYDDALYVEKESDLYKNILSQFTIETLKEDVSDPDLITGYILKYRNKKIFTEDNLEITDLDFDTFDTI